MSGFLDSLSSVPIPEWAASEPGIESLLKETHKAYFRASLKSGASDVEPGKIQQLRQYALWLEHLSLKSSHLSDDGLRLAANIYELIGSLPENWENATGLFEPPLNDLVRCSLLSSLTRYTAQATLVATRVADILSSRQPRSLVDTVHNLSATTVSRLLARDYSGAHRDAFSLNSHIPTTTNSLEELELTEIQIDDLDSAFTIGLSAGNIAAGLLIGEPNLVSRGTRLLNELHDLAIQAEDSRTYWLTDRLLKVTTALVESSAQELMHRYDMPQSYRRSLARRRIAELWGPQKDAISKGILDPYRKTDFVISVPTGSGKTLIAEMAIVAALSRTQTGWGVYLVPSRALATQVRSDLLGGLTEAGIEVHSILAGLEPAIDPGAELELLQTPHSITITTPEKFDGYLRMAPTLFETCSLMIVDEAHKVQDQTRGMLLESIVTRALNSTDRPRIVLMSGVMSNAEELGDWLGSSSEIVAETVRPTRRIYAIAVQQGAPNEPKNVRRRAGQPARRRTHFEGGLVMVYGPEDLVSPVRVDVTSVFHGHFTEELDSGRWIVLQGSSASSSITDHASELASNLLLSPGTILVFFNDTRWAESAARKVNINDDSFRTARERLARFIASELGEDHELANLVRSGVAYHHARIPANCQRAIEMGLDRGWLRVVFATSTLREGINTSASTVVVAGETFRDVAAGQNTPISEADFANLAGRAGRPRRDTEGRIILIPHKLAVASAISTARKYILSPEAALIVRSQFAGLVNSLRLAGGELAALPPDHQRLLLSVRSGGVRTKHDVAAFFNHTLWSRQEPDSETVLEATERLHATLASADERYGSAYIDLAAKVGLSIEAFSKIEREVRDNEHLLRSPSKAEASDRAEQLLAFLVPLAFQLEDISARSFERSPDPESHVPVVMSWISGDKYSRILETGRKSGVFRSADGIGYAVRYCSEMSDALSWAFGATAIVADQLIDDLDSLVLMLPLLVRFGVSSVSAAYLALAGIADRTAAEMLGTLFDSSGYPRNIASILAWSESVDLDEVFPEDTHTIRADLLRRQGIHGIPPRIPYHLVSFERSESRVGAGTYVSVEFGKSTVYLRHDGTIVGRIDGESADAAFRFRRLTYRNVSGIIIEDPSPTFGRIALMSHPGSGSLDRHSERP